MGYEMALRRREIGTVGEESEKIEWSGKAAKGAISKGIRPLKSE